MDKVSGKRIMKVVPTPRRVSTVIEPPNCFTSLCTTSMPTPRPDNCVTVLAVDKPATKINWINSAS